MEAMPTQGDRFANVVLHYERIDWSRADLDADVISSEFIGPCGYWDDPDFEGLGPHEIEKEILFSAGRDQWWQDSPYGKPYYQHFLTLMKVLFPKTDITPSLADAVMFFCYGFGVLKILNLIGCQNSSKCLKSDEEVRMFDGSVRRADEVKVGDELMGMDSTPRTVLNTCAGERMLYTVIPCVGKPFTVTENHLVTAICKRGKRNGHGGGFSSSATPGRIYEKTAKEWFDMPQWKRDSFGLFSVSVKYEKKELPVDPYIYGLWLGDGAKAAPRITVHSSEQPILDALDTYWEGEGYNTHKAFKKGTEVLTVSLTTPLGQRNPFKAFIDTSVSESKFILTDYLRGSEEQRLNLLAGIIDTDGCYAGTYFVVSCADPLLMDGYEELATSLGFRTTRDEFATNYTKVDGTIARAETLRICGDVSRVPTRLTRKQAKRPKPGRGVRKHGVTGFHVVEHGVDKYAGFEVGGDHRFLLKDYTVTHNSASSIRIPFVCMYIDPEFTVGYVANPFENAADSTVWGDIEELWDELCEEWPLEITDSRNNTEIVPSIFPKGKKYAKMKLVFVPNIPKAGYISIRHVKDTGKLKGSKSRKSGRNNVNRGFMFVLVDEINEIKSHAFLDTLENISSQAAFFSFTSQNFKDEEDMGGQITSPLPRFGGPATFDELDIELDAFWHSAKSSITLRFDGHRAPNVLAGRVIYEYLISQKDLDRLKESGGGEQSLSYFSQARSFPVRGGELNVVLDPAKTSASRHKDTQFQIQNITNRTAFCDPAFGGRDSAVYCWCEFGPAKVLDAEANTFNQELIHFRDQFKVLKLNRDATFDEHYLERFKAIGCETKDFTPEAKMSFEQQIALQCAELNKLHGVKAENFGYDFSMRPDIVTAMNQIVGFGSVAFDYNQKPLGSYLIGVKSNSEDYCYDRISELNFQAADVFVTKQIRGGQWLDVAVSQLQRTYFFLKGKKRAVEKKEDFKARWQGRSPDHRDTFVGCVGMARMRGFQQEALKSAAAGSSGLSLFRELNDSGFGKSRVNPFALRP